MLRRCALVCFALSSATAGSAPNITFAKLANTDTLVPPGQHTICGATAVCGVRSCVPPHIAGPPCDIAALEALCRQTPHCGGFNSDGWLKPCTAAACGAKAQPYKGVDTYVASGMIPGKFPPAPGPTPPPPTPPTPPTPEPILPKIPVVEDWHYPHEEATEAADSAKVPLVATNVDATGGASGSVTLATPDGSQSITLTVVGTSFLGWSLRGFVPKSSVSGAYAVVERNWARWGYVAFVSTGARVCAKDGAMCFRKGVGNVSSTRRPRYNLTDIDAQYFVNAAGDPLDFVRREMEAASPWGETTFAAAASLLPPSHDYGIVGGVDSHTKFSVAQDGRVRLANYSIYSPTQVGNVTEGREIGVLLFDPREHVSWWPSHNFSDYKTSLLGRYTRSVVLAAWDQEAQKGFSLEVVADPARGVQVDPYDEAVLLVRLQEVGGAPQFFEVRGCVTPGSTVGPTAPNQCTGPPARALLDGGARFHATLLAHCTHWASFYQGTGLQLALNYDASEGSRLVDMTRGTLTSAMVTFVGHRPNYGDGSNYWSVSKKDVGSLPLESYALNHALLLWGYTDEVASNIAYYFDHYVRGPSGLAPVPLSDSPSTPGIPGTIDLKNWDTACWFADSLADYGRWVELWVDTARVQEWSGNSTWIQSTWPQAKLMTEYMLALRRNATTTGVGKGLIYGPAEHDTCAHQTEWFSVSAWTWRGFVQLERFLRDTAAISEPTFAATLGQEATAFKADLDAALSVSIVHSATGEPFFVPPYAAQNFTPYSSMVSASGDAQQQFGGGPSYANFRYFSEMLQAQFMGEEVDTALNVFRESHSGTLSGMTRFRDHLDDMPATGYAYSAVATDRAPSFNSLMMGHIANYQSRGTFNAPEQLSLYGDGSASHVWPWSDSYRALLNPGGGELDIDTCVPSTTLVALMLRWLLVFEERDTDTIWLMKMAPRRFYTPSSQPTIIEFTGAPTRYGPVGFKVAKDTGSDDVYSVAVTLDYSGRGVVNPPGQLNIATRLRDFLGQRKLKSAQVDAGYTVSVDADKELTRVVVPLKQKSLVNFTITAVFESSAI